MRPLVSNDMFLPGLFADSSKSDVEDQLEVPDPIRRGG